LARWETVVLVAYAGLLAMAISRHEAWADEVQAWLLARDTSPWTLLLHQLHYEGTPGLWHLLLMPFAKAGLPIQAMSAIGGACAMAGAVLVVWFSPLPALVRAAYPFTYYALFQYATVARQYNLLAPLLFGIALCHRRRFEAPVRYVVLLALQSMISVDSMLVSGALAVHFMVGAWKQRALPAGRTRWLCVAAFWVFEGALALTLTTPADSSLSFAHTTLPTVARALTAVHGTVDVAYTGNAALAYILLGVCIAWFLLRRVFLTFALPTAAVLAFGAAKVQQLWHQGYPVIILFFALWLSFDGPAQAAARHAARAFGAAEKALRLAVVGVVLGMSCIQAYWAIDTISWDYNNAYAPGEAAAAYLVSHHLASGPVATDGLYWTTDLQGYFPHNLFANVDHGGGPAFYGWSTHWPYTASFIPQRRARVVVVTAFSPGPGPQAPAPPIPGYRKVAEFAGQLFWQTAVSEHEDLVIYVRDKSQTP
jgi:hypothetical protein